ncbi:hypothetical protein JG687_00006035, partial [Phytophthora cactorum]
QTSRTELIFNGFTLKYATGRQESRIVSLSSILRKSGALFSQGLQPVVYSEQGATKGLGWRHRDTHVRCDVAVSPTTPQGVNALTFQYEIRARERWCPVRLHTYTDLMDYLELLERDPQHPLTCRRLAGSSCDLLSITSPGRDGFPPDERRIIAVSAQVHPQL